MDKAALSLRLDRVSTAMIWTTLVVTVVVIGFLGVYPFAPGARIRDEIQAIGHFLFFGATAALIALASSRLQLSRDWPHGLHYLLGIIGGITLGILLEFIQSFIPGRSASWYDVWQDCMGVFAAMSMLAIIEKRLPLGNAWLNRFVLVCCLLATTAMGFLGTISCFVDFRKRNQCFPILADFDADWSRRFVDWSESVSVEVVEAPDGWPSEFGRNLILLRIHPGEQYPGLAINEPYPDWRGFDELAFEVFSPVVQPQELALRIHDFQHNDDYFDRYRKPLTLQPGFQAFRIPIQEIESAPRSRKMDLRRIRQMVFFATNPQSEIKLYIGNLRLE